MKKSAILSILLCLCMVASLVVVPVNAAEVDTNVLDGVYEASFSGQVLLVLTFNNGKLTVKDMNMGQVTGDYTYTVDADGIPVVDGNKFLFSKNMGGFLTVQPEGWKLVLDMVKVAELSDVETPDEPAIDTSKLDGVYEVIFGDLMYTMTFDNGKLTVVDAPAAANFPLAGEYTYTVVDGIPTVEGARFTFSKDMGGNYTLSVKGFPMAMTLTKVAELGGTETPDEPAIDTSKLDGVYNAEFSGQVMYILTFNNGKLTVEDKNMGTLTGEYTYTVDEDGIPSVEGGKFRFSKNMGGFLTVQPEGTMFPLDMTKVAELEEEEEPTDTTITVTTTDTYTWIDEFFFTADKAGEYTFTVPAGLGVFDADKYDDPATASNSAYIDFQKDRDGGKFTITLAAGQTIRFYANAGEKKTWTITWKMGTPVLSDSFEVETTDTFSWIDEYTFTAPADGDYTFTIPAGLGIAHADKYDDPATAEHSVYIDYQTDNDGGKLTVSLAEGESIRFYFGAKVKNTWTIEWTTAKDKEDDKPEGPYAVLGDNTISVTQEDIAAEAVIYYFVVEAAGNYTFSSNDLAVRILEVNQTGMAYLQPGIYTLAILTFSLEQPGDYVVTITTDAEPAEDSVLVMGENTIEYGEEFIKNGMDFIFEVTEAGNYYFDGDLKVIIKDANGMQINIYSSYLEPGKYIISVYNVEETAGTFTLTVSIKTEEDLEREAIDRVIALIEAIGEVTIDSKDAIQTARDFYNALSDESKALVTNLSVLEAAEEALAKLENPSNPTQPTTPPTQPTEPTTPAQPTEPTTPATQPNGNGGNEDNGSTIIIVIVVVAVVAVVAVVLLTKKKKA